MVSNLDCTGQKGEVWGEEEELGDEGGKLESVPVSSLHGN